MLPVSPLKSTSLILSGVIALHLPSAIRAQAPEAAQSATDVYRPSAGIWLGAAFHQALKTRLGHTHDNDIYVLDVFQAWPILGSPTVRLDYVAEVVPAILATGIPKYYLSQVNPPGANARNPPPSGGTFVERLRGNSTVYGLGVVPVAIRLQARVARAFAISLGGAGGLTWFSAPIPDPDERRLNWLARADASLSIGCHSGRSVTAGFRLLHISNGGVGPVNPGMNGRLITLGLASDCSVH